LKVNRFLAIPMAVSIGICVFSVLTLDGLSAEDNPRLTNECLDCHDDARESLAGTVHEIQRDAANPRVWCTGCHPGAEQHMEDPDNYRPTNPASVAPMVSAQVCSGCHTNSHQQNMQEWNVHAENNVNCGGCHKVHSNKEVNLLKKPEPGLCVDCHPKVEGEFARSFRHPVFDGVMKCTECHMSLDQSHRQLEFRGTGEVCFTCHNQFQGPFPFEHPATVEYSTEEGGCFNCHEPHGSNEPRMLKQSYEAPHFALCSQCHVVPKHASNNFHGTQWAGVACNECHVDIHGSYDNRLFLSPALAAQGCNALGCHKF
jgi:DmsE family decaheme c-type cytochrome